MDSSWTSRGRSQPRSVTTRTRSSCNPNESKEDCEGGIGDSRWRGDGYGEGGKRGGERERVVSGE